ncbi:SRPBCC domain-containing protein [Seonamhaeicola sp.]|uniref:SRPBCC family protein n=1 Tax=Seonamhaeicola sp. TaxID=1912245 RepID=UPI00262C1F4E|nr:SRPBCC domain-containing protein [Seonamhaeicola sp.]
METLSNYSTEIEVPVRAKEAFKALNEGLDAWWGQISHADFSLNGAFTITFDNAYWWTFKIIEYVPDKRLIWECIAGEPVFNKEWIGHTLHWNIEEQPSKTLVKFLQKGLTPRLHCFDVCTATWDMFITQKLVAYLK